MEIPLSALKKGESGIITSILSASRRGRGGSWGFKKRLMDMGLTPGTEITVTKIAPFGGPIEICVRGSRLALGRGMAERILVRIKREWLKS